MTRTSPDRRSLRAVGNLCNGTISESEALWLTEQLRANPAIRELYVDYLTMHACLASEAAALAIANDQQRHAPGLPIEAMAALTTGTSTQRAAGAAGLAGSSWQILAAAVALVAVLTGLLSYGLRTGGGRLAAGDSGDPSAAIAQITATQNCRWGDATGVGYGSQLVAGQTIRLREGLAEITFQNGATMLLESPATVIFKAVGDIEMREGRMAAIVPPHANNFSVHTETLQLSNVGAEFGLLARQTGTAELHVFGGTVAAGVLDADGARRRSIELSAAEAVLASPLTTTVFEFPADESHFVRSMSPASGTNHGLLAYEGFVYPEGPLPGQNGGFGWAGPWFTIAADASAGPNSNSVRAGSLAVPGIVPVGNHAAIVAQQNRIRRSLGSSIGGVFDSAGLVEDQNGVRLIGRDGTVVYLSFLQQVDAVDDGFYGLELHRGDGNANRVLCIGNGADETGYGVTSAVNVYGAKNFPALGHENTAVNFMVVKMTFGAGNRDTVEVFRNPTSLDDEQRCHADAVLNGNFAFDRISLANFDGSKRHEIDELRVGTQFLAVTGRWGGQRGRLWRQLTKGTLSAQGEPIVSSAVKYPGIFRNSLLLTTLNY